MMQSHSFREQSSYPVTPEEFRMLPALESYQDPFQDPWLPPWDLTGLGR